MADVNEGVVRVVPSFGRGSAVVLTGLALVLGVAPAVLGSVLEPRGASWLLVASLGALFGLVGLGAARAQARTLHTLTRLSIEPAGVRLGDAIEPWSSVSVDGSIRGLRLEIAGVGVRLLPNQIKNWVEVVQALRQRAVPDRWRVRERRRAPTVLWRRRAAHASGTTCSTTSTYRSPAVDPTESPLPGWWTETRRKIRGLALLGTIALAVGAPLFAHYRARHRPAVRQCREFVPDDALEPASVVDLAGFVVGIVTTVMGLSGLVLAAGCWLRHRDELHARAWVGPDSVGDGRGGVRSRDGRRRAYIERDDPFAIGSSGISMEELDARGRVQRTRFGWAASEDVPPSELRSRLVASLPRAVDSGRHAGVVSRGLFSEPTEFMLGAARVLVLDVRADGVRLIRFSDGRQHVGTTLHATRFEAEEQIADEYGVRDLPFRDAPLDGGAISFFAYA